MGLYRLLLFWAGCLLLISCGRFSTAPARPLAVPTAAAVAVAPTVAPSVTASPTVHTPTRPPTATPSPTVTPLTAGGRVSPITLRTTPTPVPLPNATAATPAVAWRPPQMPVPLTIHPDDHYWLARPIPSGSRSYALEWYPYGADVLIPQFAPLRIHHGLDFPNDPGTPVLAAGSGTVVWAGPRPSPRNGIDYYGNTVIIEHDWQWREQPVYTLYAHTLELFVAVGDRVQAGQLLAGVGGSGVVTGPHLHFEVRVGTNEYFATRNPALWLAPYEGWGTLAGRFVDRLGQPIGNARIELVPRTAVDAAALPLFSRTYVDRRLRADEVWRENFAIGDLPAGTYDVTIRMPFVDEENGGQVVNRSYENRIDILPGQTNFIVVQADFVYAPTPTPTITPTPDPAAITNTVGITDTAPLIEGTSQP